MKVFVEKCLDKNLTLGKNLSHPNYLHSLGSILQVEHHPAGWWGPFFPFFPIGLQTFREGSANVRTHEHQDSIDRWSSAGFHTFRMLGYVMIKTSCGLRFFRPGFDKADSRFSILVDFFPGGPLSSQSSNFLGKKFRFFGYFLVNLFWETTLSTLSQEDVKLRSYISSVL